jgi:O-antigen/teichoic acid export membrane protein
LVRQTKPVKPTPTVGELTSNRVLGRSGAWALAGQAIPIVVAIAAFPYLIRTLGTGRFGTLTLVWIVAGYLGFLDLGLGAALTKYAADLLAKDKENEIAPMAFRALWVMLGLGVAAGLALFLLAPRLAYDVLHTSPSLKPEVASSIRLVALIIPVITTTAALNGLLAAYQRFDVINAIGIPLSALSYGAPVVVAAFRPTLPAVVLSLAVIDVVGWVLTVYFCRRCTPALDFVRGRASSVGLRRLLSFGGWVTVANFVGPLLVYFDRFLLGAWVSMTEVAYYTTPYSIVTRVLILPSAVAQVLFPALATSSEADPERFAVLVDRGIRVICLAVFPLVFLAVLFARPALDLWVGGRFAANSFVVLQVLALGVFINAPAFVPYSMIQAVGRPDLLAKLYLGELVPYVLLLWLLVRAHGIEGVAAAWTIRCAADTALLMMIMRHVTPAVGRAARRGAVVVLIGCAAMAVAFIPIYGAFRVVLAVAFLGGFAVAGWRWVLNTRERRYLGLRLGAALHRGTAPS